MKPDVNFETIELAAERWAQREIAHHPSLIGTGVGEGTVRERMEAGRMVVPPNLHGNPLRNNCEKHGVELSIAS
jgi:hypothetical protein